MRKHLFVATCVIAAWSAACGGGDDPVSVTSRAPAPHPGRAAEPALPERGQVARARCETGAPPGYYVPHREDLGPVARVICARLPVSGESLEFSLTRARISGEIHPCLHAAYDEGEHISTTCARESLSHYAVRGVGEARRSWGDYAYVLWGTAGRPVSAVQLRYAGGFASATVFRVDQDLADSFGVRRLDIWVAELPLAAACGPVVLNPYYGEPSQTLLPRPAKCERA